MEPKLVALDFLKQRVRAASSVGVRNRAGIWIQTRIPLAKGCTSAAIPATAEEEEIMDRLVDTAQFPFEVDNAQHFYLNKAV